MLNNEVILEHMADCTIDLYVMKGQRCGLLVWLRG